MAISSKEEVNAEERLSPRELREPDLELHRSVADSQSPETNQSNSTTEKMLAQLLDQMANLGLKVDALANDVKTLQEGQVALQQGQVALQQGQVALQEEQAAQKTKLKKFARTFQKQLREMRDQTTQELREITDQTAQHAREIAAIRTRPEVPLVPFRRHYSATEMHSVTAPKRRRTGHYG